MEAHLARQGIFDRSLSVVAYEVLVREGDHDLLVGPQAEQAGATLIEGSIHGAGLGELAGGKKLFFNFTREMLSRDLAALLPPRITVVEIHEALKPDESIVAACQALKRKGYQIGVDAYTARLGMAPLMALADYVKVSFKATDEGEQRSGVERYSKAGVRMIAEHADSRDHYLRAIKLGYSLVQGLFMSWPEEVARKDIPPFKFAYLRFLQEANRPDVDFDRLEELIRQDVALSLKLLRYVNSAMFSFKSRVESIKQALVLLGLPVVRKWASLLALAAMGEDRPQELVVAALVRARFMELIGELSGMAGKSFELFLIGMFSHLDAILGRPISEVLTDLPLSPAARDALLGHVGPMGLYLKIVQAYEKADWTRLQSLSGGSGLNSKTFPSLYMEAVGWVDRIFSVTKG